ncbi:putative N-acetyltransferase YjaB [Sporotomaculum syntrophicum]|uniref:N-acetyltransferase YjaB n=2 Tax=Sporotomaculum syntrophicum TaxID=182264 RepID=A0A9D2WPD8_9FIRM|nr:N-acetyltransferase [Sporotomaculum syntrophicum]KAF1085125.1 putative N-acetyltransferase YjaB [Sporotomaculum syntrophicum]
MIRNFRKDDIEEVMKLWLDTNILAHDFIESNYWKGNFDAVKVMISNATIFVYEQKGIVKGFIGLIDGYIAGIFVCNACQSKGIGKKLLNHVKEKYDQLFLQVYKKNNRAVNFYLREEFSIQNEQIDENTGEIKFAMKWNKLSSSVKACSC